MQQKSKPATVGTAHVNCKALVDRQKTHSEPEDLNKPEGDSQVGRPSTPRLVTGQSQFLLELMAALMCCCQCLTRGTQQVVAVTTP